MSLDLRKGDVVRVSYQITLSQDVDKDGHLLSGTVEGKFWSLDTRGASRIEMVKRVARRKPQRGDFKAGQIVTADTLREVMWRRGTMICPNHHPELASVLHGDGRWHALNGEAWDFDHAEGKFELLYLPD